MPNSALPGEEFTPSPPEMIGSAAKEASATSHVTGPLTQTLDRFLTKQKSEHTVRDLLRIYNDLFGTDFRDVESLPLEVNQVDVDPLDLELPIDDPNLRSILNELIQHTSLHETTRSAVIPELPNEQAISTQPTSADWMVDAQSSESNSAIELEHERQTLEEQDSSERHCLLLELKTQSLAQPQSTAASCELQISELEQPLAASDFDGDELRVEIPPADVSLSYSKSRSQLKEIPPDELGKSDRFEAGWIWDGYLMRGGVTVMVSSGKVGKTTLLGVLLKKLQLGGTLAGGKIPRGRALIFSEEPEWVWRERHARYQYGSHVRFHISTTPIRSLDWYWQEIDNRVRTLGARRELELVVFDPMSFFLPYSGENDARAVQLAMTAVRSMANTGLSVLLFHHPPKLSSSLGSAVGRGSSAIGSMADIIVEMRPFPNADENDRRRILYTHSRYRSSRPSRVIEWTEDELDYVDLGPYRRDVDFQLRTILEQILRDAERPLSRMEILAAWPSGLAAPSLSSLTSILRALCDHLHVVRTGTGRRGNSYRYQIPPKRP